MKFLVFLTICLLGATFVAVTKKFGNDQNVSNDEKEGSGRGSNEVHNGKEETSISGKLSQEERKRRLGIIADRLDKDKNGEINKEELEDWMRKVHERNLFQTVDNQMNYLDKNLDGILEWEEFYVSEYARTGMSLADMEHDEKNGFDYKKMISRDMKRWKSADLDGDRKLTREEMLSFLFPEERAHMVDIVVTETIEDMDRNGDGLIDIKEYLGGMYDPDHAGEEPDWVKSEKKHFYKRRDRDKDGMLNEKEVRLWIFPDGHDEIGETASYLMFKTDSNSDEVLTKDEIIEHLDTFAESLVTNKGKDLERHDEL